MPLTAGEVVSRIKSNLGMPWRETTYRDTFKFGGPETEITGIATAMFCTFKVVQQAAAAGLNMIVPHEDTYWNDRDNTSIVNADPLYAAKVGFMRQHNIVIFRMHDHCMPSVRTSFMSVRRARSVWAASSKRRRSRTDSSSPKQRSARSPPIFRTGSG